MIKGVKIEEVQNGYKVILVSKENRMEYVYPATHEFQMFEAIGKFLLGRRIEVKDK